MAIPESCRSIADVVTAIRDRTNIGKVHVREIIDAMRDEIVAELVKGNDVFWPGLGVFKPLAQKNRGVGLQGKKLTGYYIRIVFHPSKPLRRAMSKTLTALAKKLEERG